MPVNAKHLIDLISIPAMFHKDRKMTFYIYKEFILHSYRLKHANNTSGLINLKYKSWKAQLKATYMDNNGEAKVGIDVDDLTGDVENMSLEDRYISESFLAYLIDKDTFMLDREYAVTSKEGNTNERITFLPNVFELSYVKGGIVRDPYTTHNITTTFQYASLLEKMLNTQPITFKHMFLPSSNIPKEQLALTLQLLDRYHRMHAQDLTMFDIRVGFDPIKIQDAANGERTIDESFNILKTVLQRKKALRQITPQELLILDLMQRYTIVSIYNVDKLFNIIEELFVADNLVYTYRDQETDYFTLTISKKELLDEFKLYMKTLAITFFVHFAGHLNPRSRAMYDTYLKDILNPTDEREVDNQTFVNKFFSLIVESCVHFINKEAFIPSAYHYHFTELARDAYFLDPLHGMLMNMDNEEQYPFNAAEEAPKLQAEFSCIGLLPNADGSLNYAYVPLMKMYYYAKQYISRNTAFYRHFSEDESDEFYDMTLQGDKQDGVIRVFDALTKSLIRGEHITRMMQLMFIQNFINKFLYNGTLRENRAKCKTYVAAFAEAMSKSTASLTTLIAKSIDKIEEFYYSDDPDATFTLEDDPPAAEGGAKRGRKSKVMQKEVKHQKDKKKKKDTVPPVKTDKKKKR